MRIKNGSCLLTLPSAIPTSWVARGRTYCGRRADASGIDEIAARVHAREGISRGRVIKRRQEITPWYYRRDNANLSETSNDFISDRCGRASQINSAILPLGASDGRNY